VGWFTKPKDPIDARQAELDREIAEIQKRIADLSTQPLPPARPVARGPVADPGPVRPMPAPRPGEAAISDAPHVPPGRFNLVEAWHRFVERLAGRPRSASGLVTLMAAGSVHGLRPLRYERKIARRRFLLSLGFLLLVLYGIARAVFRN
jgi:hypothetical protein